MPSFKEKIKGNNFTLDRTLAKAWLLALNLQNDGLFSFSRISILLFFSVSQALEKVFEKTFTCGTALFAHISLLSISYLEFQSSSFSGFQKSSIHFLYKQINVYAYVYILDHNCIGF